MIPHQLAVTGSFPGSYVNADHRGDTTLSELRQTEVLPKVGTSSYNWSTIGLHPSLARTVLCVAYILVRACTSPTAELLWRFLCTCFSPVLLRAFLHTSVMLHVRTRATVLVCSQVSVLPRTTHPLPPTGPRIMDNLPTTRAWSLLRHRSRQTLLYIAAALIP